MRSLVENGENSRLSRRELVQTCMSERDQTSWCGHPMVMDCSLAQVECHPYLAQNELIAHCHSRGLEVTAYSPLGSSDRAWRHPDEPVLLEEPVVLALAEKYGRSPAQILLRCGVFLGIGALVGEGTSGWEARVEGFLI